MQFAKSSSHKKLLDFAYNFYICGPASMKLVVHLVSKVSMSQNSGQGPLASFQNLKSSFQSNFYVFDPTSMKLIPHLVSKVSRIVAKGP